VWGLDIVGPFPRAVGGYRFLYVAIDKFTKWPEATPVVNINKQSAVKFIKSIICRFGVPNRIITDNGSSLLAAPSKGTAKIWVYRSATRPLPILRAMGRWSAPTQKYSRAIRLAPMMA
jgi:transposase-like protein